MKKIKPIWKMNGGLGATLCHKCSVIISEGLTKELYCEKCKIKEHVIYINDNIEELDKTIKQFKKK
tara:strand:+ start:312 stop:509 length:198 start_codon:yes stop_codon:yes gene_type:complete